MKQSNIVFLDLLANILEILPRTGVGLNKEIETKYIKEGKSFVQIDSEWCNNVAEELRKIVLEEEIANG